MKKLVLGLIKACFCTFDSTAIAAFIATIIVLLTGCSSNPKYIEGSTLQIGAYVPGESQLYGVEILNWLNGCKVSSTTNQPFALTREYCASNSYLWGAASLNERTKTTVDVK